MSVIYVNEQAVFFLLVSYTMIALFICQQKTFFALSSGLLATNKQEDLDAGNMVKEYTLFTYIYCTTNIVVTIQSCLKIRKGLQADNKILQQEDLLVQVGDLWELCGWRVTLVFLIKVELKALNYLYTNQNT